MEGLRYSKWKTMLHLVPALWNWALGDVCTRGAIKYASRNWQLGMAWGDIAGPMKRHMEKWLGGEVYDKDTGCHHLAMVAWNALALLWYQLMGVGVNDLGINFDKLDEFDTRQTIREVEVFYLVNNLPMKQYVDGLIAQGILNEDGSQKTREQKEEIQTSLVD